RSSCAEGKEYHDARREHLPRTESPATTRGPGWRPTHPTSVGPGRGPAASSAAVVAVSAIPAATVSGVDPTLGRRVRRRGDDPVGTLRNHLPDLRRLEPGPFE